ncbi:hypothetical protein MiSe_95290 [Microseira wollei NIES-4236]|uniref:Uncharacterized protein n=1 Tax=Microseira wollei NIES-4236 TaxID=2530354 RepID=A0AAV3XTM5_9CYAN|nr:hypothetical protein MiSe_95290 [Microseira wollei NIES-4236]
MPEKISKAGDIGDDYLEGGEGDDDELEGGDGNDQLYWQCRKRYPRQAISATTN